MQKTKKGLKFDMGWLYALSPSIAMDSDLNLNKNPQSFLLCKIFRVANKSI